MPQIKAVIFDLGDVLVSWQTPLDGKVSPKILKRALTSQIWHEFDRGRILEEECYGQLATAMGVPLLDLRDTLEKAKLSLRPDLKMSKMLKQLRTLDLKIYLASNISKPHWQYMRGTQEVDWEVFDDVFISAEMGMRKPDICFYDHVLSRIGLKHDPSSVIFMDDKLENIAAAQALGWRGIQFTNAEMAIQRLTNMLADPIAQGRSYLDANAGNMWSTTNGLQIKENFAQLLMLEASDGRQELVNLKPSPLSWNFFQESSLLSCRVGATAYPDDFDTTSIAWSILKKPFVAEAEIDQVLDLILQYRSCDGLPMVYADHSRPRFDAIVCVHVFTLFHLNGRSWKLEATWRHIIQILQNRAYLNGTYYYSAPDYFLYSLSRLVNFCQEQGLSLPKTPEGDASFLELFRARCRERVNAGPTDALNLAVRIIACLRAGIPRSKLQLDAEKLCLLQEYDGGWPACEIYLIPSTKAGIGNRGVVTALAMKAFTMIEMEEKPRTEISKSTYPWTDMISDARQRFANISVGKASAWEVAFVSGLGTIAGVAGALYSIPGLIRIAW